MSNIEETMSVGRFTPFSSKLAKFSFFCYLVFLLFGTSLPFQEKIVDSNNFKTSSQLDQILFSSLYFISFISILSKRDIVFKVIRAEKFLTIFLLWSLLSVFWSDFQLISLKRWMRVFGMVIVFLSALIYMESADEALEYLKIIIGVYIPITIFSILFIHEAIQWEFPAWRGIAKHKNELGQVAVISIIVWSYSAFKPGFKNKIITVSFLIASAVLLVGSKSTTSIFSVAFILMMSIMRSIENKIIRPTIGEFFSSIILFAFYSSVLLALYFMMDVVSSFLYAIGKDPTITGRVNLWEIVFDQTKNYFIIGCGFEGFWNVDSPIRGIIYEKLWWLPTTSHMGYLDILNETGLIGLSILMLMIFLFFKNFWKSRDYPLWKAIFITALFLNITESTIFRINEFTGDLAVFCYSAFYVQRIKSLNNFDNA